ncbi:MAG TPA: hypothetical protein DG754_01600 [Bacteroidales bacterium]|nr:hypothetical protein [Bacteroidales bacterium]
MTTGGVTYDQFFRENDILSVFASAQKVDRDSYYGANQSLSSYGATNDLSYVMGGQYKMMLNGTGLIFGFENQGGKLKDKKLGYADIENAEIVGGELIVPHTENIVVADQQQNITGVFTQVDYSYRNFKTTAGVRYDRYTISDIAKPDDDISGNVISPRVTLMYDINRSIQLRTSYAKGYRAPQIFDEDLHVETSATRRVIHQNDPNLIQETSHSLMASAAYNHTFGDAVASFLVEGFYTILQNPFANEFGEPNSLGDVIYTRVNAEGGATVNGVNLEFTFVPRNNLSFNAGFTAQESQYKDEREFGEKKFFRTPKNYGYFAAQVKPLKKTTLSATGTYTGKMLVPYWGPAIDNSEEGELRTSNPFFDMGIRLSYDIKINGATMQLFAGAKNIFNSYQSDFDIGANRDPGYVYGPNQPRAIYFGIRIGNHLR